MELAKTVVVALGGNAIQQKGEKGTIYQQFANTRSSMDVVCDLLKNGDRVILTHGNGPQVGNELIRVESASNLVPELPLGLLVADTQGGMGYMLEQCLLNVLHDRGLYNQVACIITQTLVDKSDPSLKNPTKFVGPFYEAHEVENLRRTRGWALKEDHGRGWRRLALGVGHTGFAAEHPGQDERSEDQTRPGRATRRVRHAKAGATASAKSRAGSRVSRPKNSITRSETPRARWRSMQSITRSGEPQMPCSSRAPPMCPP